MDERTLKKGNSLKTAIDYTEKALEFVRKDGIKILEDKNTKFEGIVISLAFESKGHRFEKTAPIELNREEIISLLGELELLLLRKSYNYKKEFEEL